MSETVLIPSFDDPQNFNIRIPISDARRLQQRHLDYADTIGQAIKLSRPLIELCGEYMEAWGDSLTDAPNGWPVVYSSWTLVDLLGYDRIDERKLLTKNMVHNWGFPGATADDLYTLWERNADPRKVQILWFGRNSLSDTASIDRAYEKIIAKMDSVGNAKYLILGLINSNSWDEVKGSARHNIVTAWNQQAAVNYDGHFVDPVSFFSGLQNQYEIDNNFVPVRFTKDGLHFNQDGANVNGKGLANYFSVCDSYVF